MSHNAEHAQQPQAESPDPGTHRAPQTPLTESAHAPREPGTSTEGPPRRPGSELLPQGERDKLTLRLQQALSTFVDSPRQAVGEADAVFDEIATHLTNTLTEQRCVLRESWQDPDTAAETEELRLVLRQYRGIAERLLHMSAPAGQ
ncbi:hypothetical protein [Streptomyces sp. NPDC001530]|uniref:hypothetical protein n=1 Tax=Streptomyces sp. NPDC001530 TaxID=3364582 RepID=UPI0036CCCF9B